MPPPDDALINGIYEILPGELPPVGGQLAFAVRDHRNARRELVAVQVAPDAPARAVAISTLSGQGIENMLLPVAQGVARRADGRQAQFVIQPAASGQPVFDAQGRCAPWGERALLDQLLRPAAIALDRLSGLGITHRAIRADNVFQPRLGATVILGGAWAAPPAALQPAVFEPPYSAMCHPGGRGEGSAADDVYALGVLMVALAIGQLPLADLSAEEIIRRKLERGSFAAIAGSLRLPPGIADLARGMLAEDPDHRPPPVMLADPIAARSRRVAARPPPRAQNGLPIGGNAVWDARSLAFAAFRAPEDALRLLRGPEIDAWLRRSLGEPLLATRLDEAVRAARHPHYVDEGSSDSLLLMTCIAVLDPLAPCCWQGVGLFPDGLGPLTAAERSGDRLGLRAALTSLLLGDGLGIWADIKGERVDNALVRLDWRQHRVLLGIPGWAGGFARLRYALNPLLPCLSPVLGGACVVRLSELLPALNAAPLAAGGLVDAEIAAFISARMQGRMDAEFAILAEASPSIVDPPGLRGLAQLRVLCRLAEATPETSWPSIAQAALPAAEPAVQRWHSGSERAQRLQLLRQHAAEGALHGMLHLLDDQASLQDDARRAELAEQRVLWLEQQGAGLAQYRSRHLQAARLIAQEIAAAVGIMLVVGVAILRAVS